MNEPLLRAIIFFSLIFVFSIFEYLVPYRKQIQFLAKRKMINLSFGLLNLVLVRLLSVAGLVVVAIYAQNNNLGLFNLVNAPLWLVLLICLLIFDIIIYFQHRLMHLWPVLWRFHRLHHSDIEFDTTTALRFHPIEIIFSLGIKAAAILLLGAPVLVLIIFETILSSFALWSHSNLALPQSFEVYFRKVFITPSFHRIHHSIKVEETNSNYAFHLTLWDHLFKSYKDHSQVSDKNMPIGIEKFREQKDQRFSRLLLQPFDD